MKPTNDISKRSFRLGMGVILLLALALRIWGAMGDLAQDEITSLNLVSKIGRIDQVFWKINNDNSHPLNSAWLYLVGPHAEFLAMRVLSILTGTGTVLAAGLWGARKSYSCGLIAALLFATSYLMVNYGSEARGYAGLSLCIILAVTALEDILAGKKQNLNLALFALAGMLFHYDMVMTLGVLALTCFWLAADELSLMKALDKTIQIFALPVLCIALAAVPVVLSPYSIGHIDAFDFRDFTGADNLALQSAVNIPGPLFNNANVLIALIAALLWIRRHRQDMRAMFFVIAIIGLPVVLWALNVPETGYPRHFVLCGIASILLAATIIERGWQKGGTYRIAASVALIAILFGNGVLLQKFYSIGRGHYSNAVAALTAEGATTYTIDSPQLVPMIDFYSQRLNVTTPSFVAQDEWCAKGAPRWYIMVEAMPKTAPPAIITKGPDGCQANYGLQKDYPAWGLTGADWMLFKRE